MDEFLTRSEWDSGPQEDANAVATARGLRWVATASDRDIEYARFPTWSLTPRGIGARAIPSVRSFSSVAIERSDFRELLEHIAIAGGDAIPSAGAIRATAVHVLAHNVINESSAVWYVNAHKSRVSCLWELPATWCGDVFPGQAWVGRSSVVMTLSGNTASYEQVYAARGIRFLLMEIGYLAARIDDAVAALGLQRCLVGGFVDSQLRGLLNMSDRTPWAPMLAIAVGHV